MSLDRSSEKFRAFLAARGLRLTSQRIAILQAAENSEGHFTAEDLLDTARSIDDSVSRATVYRSLPILVESAIVREVDIGKENKFYATNRDTTPAQQAQVVCQDCDHIFEISAPFMDWYGATVSSKLGLEPISHRLQVNARCRELKLHGACKNKT